MKKLVFILICSLASFSGVLNAAETINEKIQDQSNDIQRNATQKVHRIEEAACMKSDLECLKEKAANRAEETKQIVEDKAIELKNDVDD